MPHFIKIAYTYLVISIFWIFFRAPTIPDALYVLRQALVGMRNFISPAYLVASLNQVFIYNSWEIIITSGLLLIVIAVEVLQNRTSFSLWLGKQPLLVRLSVYTIVVLMIVHLRSVSIKEFIYVRF